MIQNKSENQFSPRPRVKHFNFSKHFSDLFITFWVLQTFMTFKAFKSFKAFKAFILLSRLFYHFTCQKISKISNASYSRWKHARTTMFSKPKRVKNRHVFPAKACFKTCQTRRVLLAVKKLCFGLTMFPGVTIEHFLGSLKILDMKQKYSVRVTRKTTWFARKIKHGKKIISLKKYFS